MLEYFTIEKIESELGALYEELEKTNDTEEKRNIQKAIQQRNLRLTRLMPNE